MPGTALNITIPTIGVTTWPQWAVDINTALETIIDDIEPSISTSEIVENANHSFNGYIIDDIKYISCRAGNTASIPTNSIGLKDDDWYVTDGAGRSIKLTAGGAINLAAVGGFTNDYVSSGAQAKYTSAGTIYEFLDGSGNYANIRADNVIVSNGASDVTITYGGAVDYSLTLPSTLPAGVAILTIDGSGNLSTSATIATAFTVNNANITLTGTSEIKHPDVVESVVAAGAAYFHVTATPTAATDGSLSATGTWTGYFAVPPSRVGNRFKSVTMRISKGDVNITTMNVYKVPATGTLGAALVSNTSIVSGATTITAASTTTLAAGETIVVSIVYGAAAVINRVYNLQATWDRA